MDGSPALAPPGSVESVSTLDTPSLLVDLDRLERNIARWQLAADTAGLHLRPHIKTHKSVALAAMQRDAGAHGIAVAKVGEAEVFADAGFEDIAIAYPVVGEAKWQRIARLAQHAKITLNVDSATAAEGISAAASAAGVTVHLQIDLDSGFGRCGVPAGNAAAQIALARLIEDLPGVELDGVTTHRGLFFPGAAEMSREVAGAHEGQIVVAAADNAATELVEDGVNGFVVPEPGSLPARAQGKLQGDIFIPPPEVGKGGPRRELWIWLIAAALVLSFVEWITYHRRVTV